MSSSVTCGISRMIFDHVTIIAHCIPMATKTGYIYKPTDQTRQATDTYWATVCMRIVRKTPQNFPLTWGYYIPQTI